MTAFIGSGCAALALAAASGADVETDPRSPNFGKAKIGNTTINIWGGSSTLVRTIFQLALGEKKDIKTGEIKPANSLDILSHFARGKLSPTTSLAVDWLDRKDKTDFTSTKNYIGNEKSLGQALLERITPMTASSLYDVYKDAGASTTAGLLPFALVGYGMNTYDAEEQDYQHKLQSEKDRKAGKKSTTPEQKKNRYDNKIKYLEAKFEHGDMSKEETESYKKFKNRKH